MNDAKSSLDQETVAARAKALWEQADRPNGRDKEFWYRAESELVAEPKTSRPPVMTPARGVPPLPTAPVNQVPPPIRTAVKTPSRRPPRLSGNKRATNP